MLKQMASKVDTKAIDSSYNSNRRSIHTMLMLKQLMLMLKQLMSTIKQMASTLKQMTSKVNTEAIEGQYKGF